jgi:hypothetical protein
MVLGNIAMIMEILTMLRKFYHDGGKILPQWQENFTTMAWNFHHNGGKFSPCLQSG